MGASVSALCPSDRRMCGYRGANGSQMRFLGACRVSRGDACLDRVRPWIIVETTGSARGGKNAEIKAWLSRNPRITLHFTPTSGSWLNMVEVFFGIITRPAIRRGSFDSVGQLATAIRAFFEGWNDRCHRFTWAKT